MPFIEGETLEARLARASEALRGGSPPSAAWSAIGSATESAPPASPPSAPATPPSERIARDARVGLRKILALMEEVALAVHAAHEQGIIHRDLKPGNIMVRPDGHPVVLDFGLAVDLSDSKARRFTVRGDLIGTPSYMAPEQIEGEIELIDRRTDVYALGAILYEVLTFKRAFKASGINAIYHRVLSGRIEPPRKANPTIPRDLEAVCLKAMETDPRRRYATARDFADDLRRVRTLEATLARPVSRLEQLFRRIFRG
jgi:serine/threonine protein kinase